MKNMLTVKSAAVFAAFLMAPVVAPSSAAADLLGNSETRQWNVCEWERLPDNVLMRITRRADFDEILRRMFDACPDSALGLTDRPTASVASTDSSDEPGDKSDGGRDNGGNNGRSGGDTSSTQNSGGDEGFGLPG